MGYASRAKWAKRNAAAEALLVSASQFGGARGGGKAQTTSWRLKLWAKLQPFFGHRRMRLPAGLKWGGR